MVKVNAPAMSLDASGSLGNALVFSKWKGRNYVRSLVTPANPKSGGQVGFRQMFKFLSQGWASLSGSEQTTWETLADQRVISPFNAYVSYNQQRWRNALAPVREWPDGSAGSAPTTGTVSVTTGVRQLTIQATGGGTTTTDDGLIIYRSTSSSFTPSISNAIATLYFTGTSGEFEYVDTPLEPGTYYYNTRSFGTDGVLQSPDGEVNGTAT